MKFVPGTTLAAIALLGAASPAALSQPTGADAPPEPPAPTEPSLTDASETKWEFSATINFMLVPDDRDYVQPTFIADHGWLHLEARYNYEALDTGSLWVGYNFSGEIGGGGGKEEGENTFTWAVTPILGAVFGDTTGIAPGYEATLTWWKFELYSEGEYVFDTDEHSDSFFYNWSSLTFAPVDWFYFGIVAQRTRAYQSDRDIQRGPLVGFTFHNFDLSAYVLNPDDSDPIVAFTLKVSF